MKWVASKVDKTDALKVDHWEVLTDGKKVDHSAGTRAVKTVGEKGILKAAD